MSLMERERELLNIEYCFRIEPHGLYRVEIFPESISNFDVPDVSLTQIFAGTLES